MALFNRVNKAAISPAVEKQAPPNIIHGPVRYSAAGFAIDGTLNDILFCETALAESANANAKTMLFILYKYLLI
jgi:hypothetical protein